MSVSRLLKSLLARWTVGVDGLSEDPSNTIGAYLNAWDTIKFK